MASRILKREAAKRDLIAQWVWYAENIGIEVADRFLQAAEDTLRLLGHSNGAIICSKAGTARHSPHASSRSSIERQT